MSDTILVSNDNIKTILNSVIADLKNKIATKDISLPYTTEFTKGSYLKIDGDGTMYLSNNGTYIKIGTITQDQLDIAKIYQIFSIKIVTEKWDSPSITLPTNKGDFGCVQYNGKIYCIGGYNGTYLNTVNIYDISSNSWSSGANIPTGNYGMGCIVYNGKIYCIGGKSSVSNNTVYIYDISSNTWSSGANMPIVNFYFGCTLYNNKIYCIGGYSNINTVYIYDISSNTWSTGTNIPTAIWGMVCVTYNNKIYCIGGKNSITLNTTYIYDISNNTWSTGANIPIAIYSIVGAQFGGKIYVIGGYTGSSAINNVYIYDIVNNVYSAGINMPTNRSDAGLAQYNDKIYVMGGWTSGSTYLSKVEIYNPTYTSYNTPLPSSLSTKISKIISTGTGNKIFSNDGTYKSITPSYTVMGTDEINTYLSTI